MFKMMSGVLMGILSLPGRLCGWGRVREPQGVFRRALVVDRLQHARTAIFRYAKDDRGRLIFRQGGRGACSSSFSVPMFNPSDIDRSEDDIGFSAFDIALTAIDPATGKYFNALVAVAGSLDLDSLSEAYAEVEKHENVATGALRVARVFMNPREWSDIRSTSLEPARRCCRGAGVKAMLWGAEIIVSQSVPEGTVYVCADREYVGVMPEAKGIIGIGVHNPKGVASIAVTR